MESLINSQLRNRTDVFQISVKQSKDIIKFINLYLKNKKEIDGVYNLGEKFQVLTDKSKSILKHENSFVVFSDTGSRLYESKEPIDIADFDKLIVSDSKSKNTIDLGKFYTKFTENEDIWVEQMVNGIISILIN